MLDVSGPESPNGRKRVSTRKQKPSSVISARLAMTPRAWRVKNWSFDRPRRPSQFPDWGKQNMMSMSDDRLSSPPPNLPKADHEQALRAAVRASRHAVLFLQASPGVRPSRPAGRFRPGGSGWKRSRPGWRARTGHARRCAAFHGCGSAADPVQVHARRLPPPGSRPPEAVAGRPPRPTAESGRAHRPRSRYRNGHVRAVVPKEWSPAAEYSRAWMRRRGAYPDYMSRRPRP